MPEVLERTHSFSRSWALSEPNAGKVGIVEEVVSHIGFRCGNNPDLHALTVVPFGSMRDDWTTGEELFPEAEPSELATGLLRSLLGWSAIHCNVEKPAVLIVYRGDSAPSASEATRVLFRQEPDPLDVVTQLDELKSLKHGWYDGDNQPYDSEVLDQLAEKFAAWYPNDVERPYIFPTPDGAVRAEWRWGSKDVSLEIDLPEFTAYWHWIDLDTDESDDNELDLKTDEAWLWVTQEIRKSGN